MSRIRTITLAFLLMELFPFVLFLKLISCPLCNTNTLRNTLMVFGRNVEQDDVSRTRMITLPCLLCRYLPLLYLTIIMH